MGVSLGAVTFLVFRDDISFHTYTLQLDLQSSYSLHIGILITSPERIICDEQVFTCGFIANEFIQGYAPAERQD